MPIRDAKRRTHDGDMARKSLLALLPQDVSIETAVSVAALVLLLAVAAAHVVVFVYVSSVAAAVLAFVTGLSTVRWIYWNGVGVWGSQWAWVRDSALLRSHLSTEPQQKGTLRVVCISDTHGKHRNVQIPTGDVFIHSGDFTHKGTHDEIEDFNEWLGTLPHRHKIVIAGNHDLSMDATEYNIHWEKRWRHKTFNDPAVSRELLTNCTYLENRSTVIDGVKIFGSPMTPPIPGRVMAFKVARGYAAQHHWATIPSDVDILITHGPPHGILDKTVTGHHVGDESLLKDILSRCRPKFHVFGHIHEAYGITRLGSTVFINAATSTLLGKPTHRPVVFDIPSKC